MKDLRAGNSNESQILSQISRLNSFARGVYVGLNISLVITARARDVLVEMKSHERLPYLRKARSDIFPSALDVQCHLRATKDRRIVGLMR